jgi:hypothetical protein
VADAVENPRRSRPYARGFMLANLVVVAGFLAVLGLFAYLVSTGSADKGWSSYKPTGGDVYDKAQNMADHVAPAYKYNGQPIAFVQAQPLLYQDAPVDGIGFTRLPFRKIGSSIKQFEPANATIAYVMCGTADKCGLSQIGSQETVPLLRREALELALYTFKYSKDVDSVVSLLPPEGQTNGAVYLKRKNLTDELSKPLADTLPPHQALSYGGMSEVERARVMRLTADHLYNSRFVQGPNGRTLLVLRSVNG